METENKPIKRNASLLNISREHHFGLLFCWKIRSGVKQDKTAQAASYARYFFESHLEDHFTLEENYIFPLLGNENESVIRALEQHKQLRAIFEDKSNLAGNLTSLADLLEKHIRFEERTLFMELQTTVPEKQLLEALRYHQNSPEDDKWTDKFWEFNKA